MFNQYNDEEKTLRILYAVEQFFIDMPEFNSIKNFLDIETISGSWFFSGEVIVIAGTLSILSKDQNDRVSSKAKQLMEKLIIFLEKSFRDTNNREYCRMAYQEFCENLLFTGNEHDQIVALFSHDIQNDIHETEAILIQDVDVAFFLSFHLAVVDELNNIVK